MTGPESGSDLDGFVPVSSAVRDLMRSHLDAPDQTDADRLGILCAIADEVKPSSSAFPVVAEIATLLASNDKTVATSVASWIAGRYTASTDIEDRYAISNAVSNRALPPEVRVVMMHRLIDAERSHHPDVVDGDVMISVDERNELRATLDERLRFALIDARSARETTDTGLPQ